MNIICFITDRVRSNEFGIRANAMVESVEGVAVIDLVRLYATYSATRRMTMASKSCNRRDITGGHDEVYFCPTNFNPITSYQKPVFTQILEFSKNWFKERVNNVWSLGGQVRFLLISELNMKLTTNGEEYSYLTSEVSPVYIPC